MNPANGLLVFTLDQRRYGLGLSMVERVVHLVEVIPLPHVSKLVMGVVNVRGRILPVIDLRPGLCLPPRELNLDDRLIIARASRGPVALRVDAVIGLIECPEPAVIHAETILPGFENVEGIAKIEDNLVIIQNLDALLSFKDMQEHPPLAGVGNV